MSPISTADTRGTVIARYNLRQTLLAILSLAVGVFAFAAAWYFFDFAFAFAIQRLGGNVTAPLQSLIAWICVASIALVGYLRWRKGGGYHHFHESGMMPTVEPHTGLGLEVHTKANRLGAWAYLLGQLFLAGPLQILGAYDRLQRRIPDSPLLENELIAFRDKLRAKNRWLPISDFTDREQQLAYLSRLGLVDFSPRKGTFKAR